MEIKVIGNPLSQYGSATFYKGLRITVPTLKGKKSNDEQVTSNEKKNFIMGMGECIPVRPFASDPLIECLAEIRMIWRDKSEQTLLLSLRLYYLPENTPKGRNGHGEDELVAVKDLEAPKGRIVIKAEDFASWLVEDLTWNWGLLASFHERPIVKPTSAASGMPVTSLLSHSKLDLSEIELEKIQDGNIHSNVTVLSYSRYCRYRAAMKRLEHIEDNQVRTKFVETLSGFIASHPNTRIMFARESFECSDMDSHDMLCPHLAPKLKGKPRGRRKKISSRISECSSPAPSSEFSVESNETNDSDVFDGKHLMKNKDLYTNSSRLTRNKTKSEPTQEIFTTLSTGRVSKQRLPLTPLKHTVTNKRKRKSGEADDVSESSDEDDQQDEDYEDKNINRKVKQEGNSKRYKSSSKEENYDDDSISSFPHFMPGFQVPFNMSKSPEEIEFLMRLNAFMVERSQSNPKLFCGLKDVNLFTIYTRVQKLGGFDAIADNRVWKNLFEDLSEPGKCITQGMTKRKYERILLPFERYEREIRENGSSRSELTISTISKQSMAAFRDHEASRVKPKRRSSTSPAIEIIPLKNGAVKNELTMEQFNEIQKIIKPGHSESNSNDGMSLPVHVIVRPTANGSSDSHRNVPSSSRSLKPSGIGGQKENIPMSTTIVPQSREGVTSASASNMGEDVDSDDDRNSRAPSGSQHMKKRKLDILREGGLEVTPISRRGFSAQPYLPKPSTSRQTMQPNVSLMSSFTHIRAPPVIQSLNMYQSTSQVFKNPKEDVIDATRSAKSYCLDLTSRKQSPYHQQPHSSGDRRSKNALSIEEVQRAYRGSNPDLQITLVKPQQEAPSSSMSSSQNNHNVPHKKLKNVPPTQSPVVPPLNSVLLAAANELQKIQQQNMPFFPFLSSGLDVTPMQQSGSSKNPSSSQSVSDLNSSLMSYLSALYANPLFRGNNMMSNLNSDILKLYKNSSSKN